MTLNVRVVVGTRETREDFFAYSATGRSLALYKFPYIELVLFEQNKLGLPTIYNRAIEAARDDPAILVFMHDDIHLCDFYWAGQIANALTQFQVVGLAGNKRRAPFQCSWIHLDSKWTQDDFVNLSGIIGHGHGFPPERLSVYGDPYQEVKLLDGLMLACESDSLIKSGQRFDESFDFHFYDMDFCRQSEMKNLRMGTWGISIVHESVGNFGSATWERLYEKYIEKWGS